MALSLESVTEISRRVANQYFSGTPVVGVVSGDGESNRVEVMIVLPDHAPDPHRVMLNLPRYDTSSFERELRAKLLAALELE